MMHYIFQTIVFAYCDRHAMRDRNGRERLAIARDGTVLVLMSACGNGMGMDLFQRDGTGYDFHSRVPLYTVYTLIVK